MLREMARLSGLSATWPSYWGGPVPDAERSDAVLPILIAERLPVHRPGKKSDHGVRLHRRRRGWTERCLPTDSTSLAADEVFGVDVLRGLDPVQGRMTMRWPRPRRLRRTGSPPVTLHAHTQVLGKLAVVLGLKEPQLQHAALRLTAAVRETPAAAGPGRIRRACRGARLAGSPRPSWSTVTAGRGASP